MKTFLNIPQKVELAITLVTELAVHGMAEPRSLEDIARKDGLSQGYLEEVARLLRSAGLIVGRRGAKGGYVLAKKPEEITVADVITAVEGRCWSENCLGQERDVAAERHEIWRKVQGQVMATLYGMTIKDLH